MLNLIRNPEGSFRYLPVIKDLARRSTNKDKILEVGGGDFNLTNFWSRPITVLDTLFNPAIDTSLITKIVSTGQKFPFSNASFDFVITLDTLEHILEAERPMFLKELQRVAKRYVYIGFPEGAGASRQDLDLSLISSEKFLREHLENGLPQASVVVADFNNSGWRLIWQRSNVNLRFRLLLMWLWLRSNHSLLWKLVFKAFGLLGPMYRLFSVGKCYRQIFLFEKTF